MNYSLLIVILLVFLLLVLVLLMGILLAQRHKNTQDMGQQVEAITRMQGDRILEQVSTTHAASQAEQRSLIQSLNERLDKVSQYLGKNLLESDRHTSESLSKLHERLGIIDSAQTKIMQLSSQFVTLQNILSDKQQRGAFGQGRMESIIKDALPSNSFSFQATLSNNTRPDCLISLPDTKEQIVIDAKFPLESFQRMKDAEEEQSRKQAEQDLRRDITKHLKDIHSRYFLPGETQETAMMFVPSESVYAELYERFPDVVQNAYRLRIIIVSPSMLMLAIQVMQSIMKDAKMREQAHTIRDEITNLTGDVERLQTRVAELKRHFGLVTGDLEKISISSGKIVQTIARIGKIGTQKKEESEPRPSEDR